MPKTVWNLQLFAEDEGAVSAADTESTPNDTGAEVSGDAAQSMGEMEVVDASQQEGTENPETERVSFDDLINGDYKDDFKKATSSIVKKAKKKVQSQLDQANASISVLQPMMMTLAQKYQLDVNDPNIDQNIVNAVMNDEDLFAQEAMDAGMDPATYRRVRMAELNNQMYAQRERQMVEDQQRQELMLKHQEEAKELKKKYPDFDLQTEVNQNEDFAYLLDVGVPVENAYVATNWQEISAIQAEAIASKAKEQVVDNIKAGKQRPAENGLEQQPGSQIGTKISDLSKEELEELNAKAIRGEKVDLKGYSI